jgi:hypothetical protein
VGSPGAWAAETRAIGGVGVRTAAVKVAEDVSEILGQVAQAVGSAASKSASYRHLSQGCDHHGDRGDEF